MVGAEGFEVSFPNGHYAVFFVEIKGNSNQNQRFPNFSGVPFFPYSLTSGPHSARIWYHWYHPLFESSAPSRLSRCTCSTSWALLWFPTRVRLNRSFTTDLSWISLSQVRDSISSLVLHRIPELCCENAAVHPRVDKIVNAAT
jgi:hypothetical protein